MEKKVIWKTSKFTCPIVQVHGHRNLKPKHCHDQFTCSIMQVAANTVMCVAILKVKVLQHGNMT